MAGGITVGKISTAIPGVYVTEKIADLGGKVPTKGVLMVAGDFDFLKKNTPVTVESDAAMRALAPGDSTIDLLSDILFSPSPDANVGRPASVSLISPKDTTAAAGFFPDASGAAAVTLHSTVYGGRGNAMIASLIPTSGLGGFDFTLKLGDISEAFRVSDQSNVIQVIYDDTGLPAGSPSAVVGFLGASGQGSGVVSVQSQAAPLGGPLSFRVDFNRSIPDTAVGDDTNHTWTPAGPVWGVLSFTSSGETLDPSASALKATISGVDNATGLPHTEVLDITGASSPISTVTTWASVDYVSIYQVDASGAVVPTGYTGTITISGTNFEPFSASTGFAAIADVISKINSSGGGFSAVTSSHETLRIATEDLDALGPVNVTTGAVFTAYGWAIVDAVTHSSRLATAERAQTSARPTAATSATATTIAFAGGASASSLSQADWQEMFDELRWYNANVIALMSDDTAIIELARKHAEFMHGNGANERQVWAALADTSAYTACRSAALSLDSGDVSLVSQSGKIITRHGVDRSVSSSMVAANLAAIQCSVPSAVTINGHRTRLVSVTSAWTRDELDAIIRAGITALFAAPGSGAPRIVRAVTTKVTSDNVILTEVSARESSFLLYRLLRTTLKDWLDSKGYVDAAMAGSAATLIDSTLEQAARGNEPIIFGHVPGSVEVTTTGSVISTKCRYMPLVPPLFGIIEATAEVASVTASA